MRVHQAFGRHIDLDHILAITEWTDGDKPIEYDGAEDVVVLGYLTLAFRDRPMAVYAPLWQEDGGLDKTGNRYKEDYLALIEAWKGSK